EGSRGARADPRDARRARRVSEARAGSDDADDGPCGRRRRELAAARRREHPADRHRGQAVIAQLAPPTPKLDFVPVLPELILCGAAIVTLLYEAVAPRPRSEAHLV